jgi:hypothetical protein
MAKHPQAVSPHDIEYFSEPTFRPLASTGGTTHGSSGQSPSTHPALGREHLVTRDKHGDYFQSEHLGSPVQDASERMRAERQRGRGWPKDSRDISIASELARYGE